MNARTSRLLARVAHAQFVHDQRDPRPPEAFFRKSLKKAWNRTPRDKRGTTRPALVNIFHTLIAGPK